MLKLSKVAMRVGSAMIILGMSATFVGIASFPVNHARRFENAESAMDKPYRHAMGDLNNIGYVDPNCQRQYFQGLDFSACLGEEPPACSGEFCDIKAQITSAVRNCIQGAPVGSLCAKLCSPKLLNVTLGLVCPAHSIELVSRASQYTLATYIVTAGACLFGLGILACLTVRPLIQHEARLQSVPFATGNLAVDAELNNHLLAADGGAENHL